MPSADARAGGTPGRARASQLPRSLRTGSLLGVVLAAMVAFEFGLLSWLSTARERGAPDPLAIARAANPIADRDLFRLHRALSRNEPHADPELVRALLSAPDGRVREFAASPTLAKFGFPEPIEQAIAERQRPRESFRMRLWLYYQLGVHEPPRFLTIERIRAHLASLDSDPHPPPTSAAHTRDQSSPPTIE